MRGIKLQSRERRRESSASSILCEYGASFLALYPSMERNINSLDQNQHPQISLHLFSPPLTLLNTHTNTLMQHQYSSSIYEKPHHPPLYLPLTKTPLFSMFIPKSPTLLEIKEIFLHFSCLFGFAHLSIHLYAPH